MNFAALRSPRVLVALLLLLLVALTAPRVFTAPLWGDELRTWRDGIEKPLADVLAWRHNPDHAPLGHLLARGGAAVFGVDHAWALRLGAWLCGLACVPALWRLGRAIHSDFAGVLMATMFVVDPTQVFQITQARMYPPMILASIVALTLAVRLLREAREGTGQATPPWHPIVAALGLAVAVGVGIWAHAQIYAVVLGVLVAAIVRLAWQTPRDADPSRGTGGSKFGAILAIVALLVGLGIGSAGVAKLLANRGKPPLVDANVTLERPAEQLEDASQYLTGHNVLTAVVVASALVGLGFVARKRPATALLLGATVGFAALNLLIAARYRPIAHARYLAVAQPPLWGAIAVALIELTRPRLRRQWVEVDEPAPPETRTFVANGSGSGAEIRPHRGRRAGVSPVAIVLFTAFAGLCGFQLWRTLESLPAHPLAAPFREACRYVIAHRAAGARVVVLPGSPLQTYARFYGLDVDVALDDAVTKMPRGERRRPTSRPALAAENEIWLLGITPTTERWRGTGDDPLVANEIISRARRQIATTLPTTTDLGRREVIVVRYPPHGAGERIDLPGRSSPAVTVGGEE